ncbi:hypothetical protein OAB57_03445 [Bacteriovoracaceae bacterium]|nr:hypothetical protein [Bacteriovoracaceae bacterium]
MLNSIIKLLMINMIFSCMTLTTFASNDKKRKLSPIGMTNWDPASFTNPETVPSRPDEYTFIVHAMMAPYEVGKLQQNIETIIGDEKDLDEDFNPNVVDLLADPKSISRKPLISTSIISEDTGNTFGSCGFILHVPNENYVASSAIDTGTNNHYKIGYTKPALENECNLLKNHFGLHFGPIDLLSKSYKNWYNEVVVTGTSLNTSSEVKINGIFIMEDEKGESLCDVSLELELRKIGKEHILPIIYLNRKTDPLSKEDADVIFNQPEMKR